MLFVDAAWVAIVENPFCIVCRVSSNSDLIDSSYCLSSSSVAILSSLLMTVTNWFEMWCSIPLSSDRFEVMLSS